MNLDLRWRQSGRGRLLLVVHGYREHPAAALLMASILDPQGRMSHCAPLGGVELGPGERSFYRIDVASRRADIRSMVEAVQQVDSALDEACEVTGTEHSEAVLAGFSQGAGLAMGVCFSRSEKASPAGLLVFSGKLYREIEQIDWRLEPTVVGSEQRGRTRTNVFWAHGTDDQVFSHQLHLEAVDLLVESGAVVSTLEVAANHVLTPEALAAGRDWLATNWLDIDSGGST